MPDQNNILVGACTLAVDGVDVGYTQGGVTLRSSDEYLDVDADQLGGVARKVKTFERMMLTTTLLEATNVNLRKAMRQPAAHVTGSGLTFGTGDLSTVEHTITVTGEAPSAGTRTYTFYRAVAVDDVDHLIGARDAVSGVPIGFELLKSPTNGNQFGYFIDS